MAKAVNKLDYTRTIPSPEGTDFTGPNGKAITLREAISVACSTQLPGDDTLDMVAKYKVGEIVATIYKDLPLSAEQIVTVKERSAKAFINPVLIFVLHDILEGKS